MKSRIPAPRLLPVTICVLALVLAAKSASLLHAALTSSTAGALIATAWASGPDKPDPKPPARPPAVTENKPAAGAPAAPSTPPAAECPPPVADSERALLLELRDRRRELETREATLAAREAMAAAAESKLSARVDELQGLQKKLEGLDASQKQQEDAAWKGLVKVYEDMKPRDAATIFNDLGMQVLLAVVDRMKEAKASAILAAMTPDRAREVTMQLALLHARPAGGVNIGDKPALQPPPAKAPGSGT